MNNTYCLKCGTISKGKVCNECGGTSVVIPNYDENGFKKCRECGQVFRFSVNKCSTCEEATNGNLE